MSLHRAAVIAVGLAFSTTAANADWQYTKWGMTPDQVIEASTGQAERITPLTREYRLRGKLGSLVSQFWRLGIRRCVSIRCELERSEHDQA